MDSSAIVNCSTQQSAIEVLFLTNLLVAVYLLTYTCWSLGQFTLAQNYRMYMKSMLWLTMAKQQLVEQENWELMAVQL